MKQEYFRAENHQRTLAHLERRLEASERMAELMQRERDHYRDSLNQFLDVEVRRAQFCIPAPIFLPSEQGGDCSGDVTEKVVE